AETSRCILVSFLYIGESVWNEEEHNFPHIKTFVCATLFDDRDQLLRVISGQSIDGLRKGDSSQCQFVVEELTADQCGTNPPSYSVPNETL
ncbi:hypothetical protein NPIL_161501, partial [Nephila pilipes]